MKKEIKYLIMLIMLFYTVNLSAQEGLHISDVFQYYGKKHGSTMVQLSSEVLSPYNMTLYISLSFHPTKLSNGLDWVTDCIDQDKKRAKKIKETILDGKLQSGYYQLSQIQKGTNRFILFKINQKQKATLIYIEGTLDSAELVTMLFNK